MIPFELCRDFPHEKTRVPGLSFDTVCVILCLAASLEHRLVTDGQTDRHTMTNASQHHAGKNCSTEYFSFLHIDDYGYYTAILDTAYSSATHAKWELGYETSQPGQLSLLP